MTKPYYALSPSIKWISHICTEREVKASISLSLSDQSLRPSNLLLLFFTSMVSSLESSWIHHTEQFGFVILTYTPSPTCWPHLCWYWILMHKIYAYIISVISLLGFVLKTNSLYWPNCLDVGNSKRGLRLFWRLEWYLVIKYFFLWMKNFSGNKILRYLKY